MVTTLHARSRKAAPMSAEPIPLVDLHAQYRQLRPKVIASLLDVLDDMHLYLGPQQKGFEREFADFCGAAHGVSVCDGTEALTIALRACGVGPGCEVITTAHSFMATVEAIANTGATPIFADIDPVTYTLDWRQLESLVTDCTKAIIPVHIYGHPAEMDPIMDFARKYELSVVEDASQAHGATYKGRKVGSIGDVGCFSLYCSKNLGAYGEAGVCVTNDATLAEKMAVLRDHGSRVRYEHNVMGVNGRMDEMQAAILRVKLPHLDDWNERRRAHAAYYSERLRDVVSDVPAVAPEASHVFHLYVVRVANRDALREALQAEGIGTGIHYPIPLHLQPACARYEYAAGAFPVVESIARQIISLPMYPEITQAQLDRVIAAVERHAEK
jgi:dTDP-4-amino-4,6-dideoxygalactose transaminase